MKRTKLFDYIYWRKKSNTFENKYKTELANNDSLKTKLIETQDKLIALCEKHLEENEEFNKRLSNLEKKVKEKKKDK